MATLDDNFIEPSEVSLWPTALRYGGIAAVILIAMALVMHLTGMVDYAAQGGGSYAWISSILKYVIWTAALVMAIKYHRDNELGGFISFGRGFGVAFVTSLVIGLLSGIYTFLFFSFIAPEALDVMYEAAIENMPEDQAEAAGGMMEMMMSPIAMIFYSLFEAIFGGGIASLIVAAIMKRERPYA